MPEPRPATHARQSVVVVGSINIDHVISTDVFPSPGETILGNAVSTGLGGKGANQAVAAAIGGAPVRMLARVGRDAEGEMALSRLAERGVDVAGVTAVAGVATGTAWITVTPRDNTIVVVPGANARWNDYAASGGFAETVGSALVTVAQLEVPLGVIEHAVACSHGTFILNAAPAQALPASLLTCCDVLIVNEHELRVVSGAEPEDGLIEPAHRSLLRQGVGAVVTTLGAAGAVLTDDHGTFALPAFPADVVDTTGAGDAFTGVLAARLATGDSLADAVRWGMAAGSLAVRRHGAQESFPAGAEIRALLTGSNPA